LLPWNKNKFDLDTYYGVHEWVKRTLGRPKNCQNCNSDIHVEWANKNHKYNKELIGMLKK
jgi:arginyl-tRNA--protein-N-Asp/Glu arginylyltransferase